MSSGRTALPVSTMSASRAANAEARTGGATAETGNGRSRIRMQADVITAMAAAAIVSTATVKRRTPVLEINLPIKRPVRMIIHVRAITLHVKTITAEAETGTIAAVRTVPNKTALRNQMNNEVVRRSAVSGIPSAIRPGYKVSAAILVLMVAALSGCYSPHGVYTADIDERGWNSAYKANVVYDNADTVSGRKINLIFRHNKSYPYDRLVVAVTFTSPSGRSWCDTVNLGSYAQKRGDNRYYETEQLYRDGAVLSEAGRYTVEFSPVMPEETVVGVSAVGVNIY